MSTIAINQAGLDLVTGESYGLDPDRDIVLTVLENWEGGGTLRRASTPRLNKAGEFYERGYRGAKMMTIEGSATFPTRREAAEFAMELEATMADGTEGTLTVRDDDLGLTRFQQIYLTAGVKITRNGEDVDFVFDVMAPDPYKSGTTVTTASTPTDGTVKARNTGTADAALTYSVAGNYPNGFTISGPDGDLQFTGAINATAVPVVIDDTTGKVTQGTQDLGSRLIVREWSRVRGGTIETFTLRSTDAVNPILTIRTVPKWQ